MDTRDLTTGCGDAGTRITAADFVCLVGWSASSGHHELPMPASKYSFRRYRAAVSGSWKTGAGGRAGPEQLSRLEKRRNSTKARGVRCSNGQWSVGVTIACIFSWPCLSRACIISHLDSLDIQSLHSSPVTTRNAMSRASKLTLVGCSVFAAVTVVVVHYQQKFEKDVCKSPFTFPLRCRHPMQPMLLLPPPPLFPLIRCWQLTTADDSRLPLQAMHLGVVRDMEQQRVKKERQLDFEMQRALEEEYKKGQTVRQSVADLEPLKRADGR